MRPAVRAAFLRISSEWEGVCEYPYLDVLGLVTVAIGNLIDPVEHALTLPFVRADWTPATRAEIASAWLVVKGQFCGVAGAETRVHRCPWRPWTERPCLAHMGHRAARAGARIRLTDEGIATVVGRRLDSNEAILKRRYKAWEEWPADAQLASLSMAWAMGPNFHGPFPRLHAALAAGDFLAAAEECHMNEKRNPGIVERNKGNRVMYVNAAMTPDPAQLVWPRDLTADPVLPEDAPTVPELEDPPSTRVVDFEVVRSLDYVRGGDDEPPDAA